MLVPLLAATATLASIPGWRVDAETLAKRHAPVLVHEAHRVGSNATQDVPVAFDFDGDWDMGNNWRTQPRHTREARPTVHYAVVASEARAWITYYLFYPRDWARVCLPMICHENDLEQFTVAVENDGTDGGRLLFADVKFHRGYSAYPVPGSGAAPRVKARGTLARTTDGRPLLRVAWGGHGITSCDDDGDRRLDGECAVARTKNTRVLHREATPAFAVRGAKRPATYRLIPLRDTLWAQRGAGGRAWGRDALAYAGRRLGRLGHALGVAFAGSGPGGGARAPWGVRPQDGLGAGDRFFDPELAFGARWSLPARANATAYVEHRFRDDLALECSGGACDAPAVTASIR